MCTSMKHPAVATFPGRFSWTWCAQASFACLGEQDGLKLKTDLAHAHRWKRNITVGQSIPKVIREDCIFALRHF